MNKLRELWSKYADEVLLVFVTIIISLAVYFIITAFLNNRVSLAYVSEWQPKKRDRRSDVIQSQEASAPAVTTATDPTLTIAELTAVGRVL